jgi:hypothetical protein
MLPKSQTTGPGTGAGLGVGDIGHLHHQVHAGVDESRNYCPPGERCEQDFSLSSCLLSSEVLVTIGIGDHNWRTPWAYRRD